MVTPTYQHVIARVGFTLRGGPSIGVARIFEWGGPKPQITRNDVIRNFRKSNFLWGKDIVEWKI